MYVTRRDKGIGRPETRPELKTSNKLKWSVRHRVRAFPVTDRVGRQGTAIGRVRPSVW